MEAGAQHETPRSLTLAVHVVAIPVAGVALVLIAVHALAVAHSPAVSLADFAVCTRQECGNGTSEPPWHRAGFGRASGDVLSHRRLIRR